MFHGQSGSVQTFFSGNMLKCWHIHVNKICCMMYLPIYLAGGMSTLLYFGDSRVCFSGSISCF